MSAPRTSTRRAQPGSGNVLGAAAAEYLLLRRAVGFKLEVPGRLLPEFAAYAEARGAIRVSVPMVLEWANLAPSANQCVHRLGAVRGFALWFQSHDAASEVPPAGLIVAHRRRQRPYLYTDDDIAALMGAARSLQGELRAATYGTLFGLLAVTGLRVGEALRLAVVDVDLDDSLLTVWHTKFNKNRQVPISPTARDALAAYDGLRRHHHPRAATFFVAAQGGRLHHRYIHRTFHRLLTAAGLPSHPSPRPPRIHDFRHSFAVATLVAWYRAGLDVQALLPRLSTYLGHVDPASTYWYLSATPELMALAARRRDTGRTIMTLIAPALEAFFTERLVQQRQASPNTISSYRDALRLLLAFARDRTGIPPAKLTFADLDAEMIAAFLHHLEHDRHNSVGTRNARLAAIRSFFGYASYREPAHAALIQRVLAIPEKRTRRTVVCYLTGAEVDALLAAPDRTTWTGRRDHALLALTISTGVRVSELTGLRRRDVTLAAGAHIQIEGKGRKERITPLDPHTAAVIKTWLAEHRGHPDDPLFPSNRGIRLSRDAVAQRVAKHTATARGHRKSLATKNVTPHTLRHTCAMEFLASGVDIAIIALWLGHEHLQTTDIYLHGDLTIKQRALARTAPRSTPPGRYRPSDALLAFLDDL